MLFIFIMYFDSDKFDKWEEETHIPKATFDMVNFIAEKIGCSPVQEETIHIHNRGGQVVGYGKGFSITHCTSSLLDGPSTDYSSAFTKWLKGLGFKIENSYGDNGMDSATNWHDTFWTHDFIYNPSIVWEEEFIVWEDKDYNE